MIGGNAALYSPNEFLYARPIADAILSDVTFRQWFLSGTTFANIAGDVHPLPEDQAKLRTTERAREWWWFNYFCHDDCSCAVNRNTETDILIIFATTSGFRFAVHVEIKLPGKKLEPGQAETYPRRAKCWAHPNTRPKPVLAHDGFVTILVCGDNLESDGRRSNFDDTRFHRDIEQRLSPYPDLTDIRKHPNGVRPLRLRGS